MESKGNILVTLLPENEALPLIRAYYEINHLKQLYRQGWLQAGIPKANCESVAEHTFGVAVLAWVIAEEYFPDLELRKVLRMALIHDFGEIYAGDFTPGDRVLPEEKVRLERQSVERVCASLPGGREYLALWDEYESGISPEARFVRQIDRLEMGLQASIYQRQGYTGLNRFFESASAVITESVLVEIMEAVHPGRNDERDQNE
jgi:putative hydrolase of HD superfamily